jgi:hypothetical protein
MLPVRLIHDDHGDASERDHLPCLHTQDIDHSTRRAHDYFRPAFKVRNLFCDPATTCKTAAARNVIYKVCRCCLQNYIPYTQQDRIPNTFANFLTSL